jgi:hypothetical protein
MLQEGNKVGMYSSIQVSELVVVAYWIQ